MSQTLTPITSTVTTAQVAETLLGAVFALTNTLTDATQGSIIRTYGEAVGAIDEMASATATASTFQGGVYGAYAAFGIVPFPSTSATGSVTFSSTTPATSTILIPGNTVVATTAGIQFYTDSSVTLVAGQTSVSVNITAVLGGLAGNVPANSISQILSGVSYPLSVTNTLSTTGGTTAETPQATAARFAAKLESIGLASPSAIANAVIGVSYNGESVEQSSVYEPWITDPSVGAEFYIYIDNGSGTASTNLITAVTNFINTAPGYRPAGVPFSVFPVTPVDVAITITGTVFPQYASQITAIETAIQQAVQATMSKLQIGATLYLGQIAASAANGAPQELSSFNVTFSNGSDTVEAAYNERVIATSISVTLT